MAQIAYAQIGGLDPDTAYRFRLVAENENGESTATTESSAPRFVTFPLLGAGLPDDRAYELVSPALKAGEVMPARPLGSTTCAECIPSLTEILGPMRSAPDGESVAYMGQPFAAGFASGPNEYRAKRGTGGWGTQSLSPGLFAAGAFGGYEAFSPDLSRSVVYQVEPILSEEAPTKNGKGFANLYLREADGSLRPLVTEATAPENRDAGLPSLQLIPGVNSNGFRILYAGANPGTATAPQSAFTHVVFEANDALTDAAPPNAPAAPPVAANEANLYEWFDEELRLINVLPGNNAAVGDAVIGSGRLLAPRPLQEGATVDRAISEDGSRIFWSEEPSGQLYVRIDGEETREITNPGLFLTASADGSKVLLDTGCLYDVDAEACEEDLTQGQGGFEGILGSAEDLSRIYLIDSAVLTGGEENANGEAAEAGENNLYAWGEGTTTFVGILRDSDNAIDLNPRFGAWKPSRANRTAQVSPDGRYLSFISLAALTGYDNAVESGGGWNGGGCIRGSFDPLCLEVFAYDAVAGTLGLRLLQPHRPAAGGGVLAIGDE